MRARHWKGAPLALKPRWLVNFVDRVAACTLPLEADADVGCHVFPNTVEGETEWEVTLFPCHEEHRERRFFMDCPSSIDLIRLLLEFDDVAACRWQSAGLIANDDLGPHVSVEGRVNGHRIWLRLLSRQPERLAAFPS